MSVTGYLALYTTLLGWQQYNNLWQIAVGTGLIYLPFIGIVLKSAIGPFTSMGAKDAAQIAVRRLVLNVISALFVIVFAAVPTVLLDPKVLHYDPLCTESTKSATPGDTGTTYDNAFPVPTGVKVPILWYFIMAFSNGITHAANVGLPCSPINYRALHSELDTSSIQDPALKQEIVQFYNDCYVPAYSTYLSGQANNEKQAQIDNSLEKHGAEDIGWLGSQTLLQINGFYDARSATAPVKGFPFDLARDIEESQVPTALKWGRPNCKIWWNDAENGLFKKLKDTLPPNFLTSLMHLGGDTEKIQEVSIQRLINHNFHSGETMSNRSRGYESLENNTSGNFISRYIGAPLGILYESFSSYPKLHLLINALPIIQGSLLFALYAFLAIAIPFSSYRVGFCVTVAVVMFSLIFCSYLWQLVQWFDSYLIRALYPSIGDVAGLGILNAENGKTTNQLFVEMIVGTLYVVLPLLWMTVMGWVGFEIGGFVTGLFNRVDAISKSASDGIGSVARKKLL